MVFVSFNASSSAQLAIINPLFGGTIPEGVWHLDENILVMDGGILIFNNEKVVGGIGGLTGSEDICTTKTG